MRILKDFRNTVKLQPMLHRDYWSVLCSRGRNYYDRPSTPSNPTIIWLSDLLKKSLWILFNQRRLNFARYLHKPKHFRFYSMFWNSFENTAVKMCLKLTSSIDSCVKCFSESINALPDPLSSQTHL